MYKRQVQLEETASHLAKLERENRNLTRQNERLSQERAEAVTEAEQMKALMLHQENELRAVGEAAASEEEPVVEEEPEVGEEPVVGEKPVLEEEPEVGKETGEEEMCIRDRFQDQINHTLFYSPPEMASGKFCKWRLCVFSSDKLCCKGI